METFTKGDIVLFPFPYTDLTNRKIRPCLVVFNEMREDIILCQITSQSISGDDYSIELQSDETIGGTLKIDSYIRANMIFTAAKNQIKMKLCKIGNDKYSKVSETINKIISKK